MRGDWFQRYITNIVLTVVCFLTRSSHTATSQCSSAHGTSIIGQRLDGYVFRTLNNMGPKQCAHECFTRPSCLSFNYHTNMTCELNSESDSGQSVSLSQHTGYAYSRIDTWTGFSGECTRFECSVGQKCLDLIQTTTCVYTECMDCPQFGVTTSVKTGVVGQSFPAECKNGYKSGGFGANVTCMGSGVWGITSSYCYGIYPPDWILMARFESGNGKATYDTWLETGRDDNKNVNMSDECKETNTSNVCTRHFRNGLIDDWKILNHTEVKFSLYTAGIEVVYLIFNATDTNTTSWFAKERLLSTSFTDLNRNSTTPAFSVYGFLRFSVKRRFYIHNLFGSCETDIGWLQINDEGAECFYEKNLSLPIFFYSKNNAVGRVGQDTLAADVFAIFIKV